MGIIISRKDYLNQPPGLMKPIIFCDGIDAEAGFSINLIMAEKLSELRPNRRSMKLESIFTQIVEMLPDDAVIKDIDVMFNPNYQVDVLKILTTTCKRKNFSIIWPGKYEDGKLFYAEDGYPDFKAFSVKDYDVSCII